MTARWLRLWFGFSDPVGRGTYLRHGLGLTAFKYGIDALLVWRFAGIVWTPLNYLSPLLTTRQALLRGAPAWLLPLMAVIALPFLWIGVSMTMRRAVDAGASPWVALLFFVPGLNLVLMLALCLPPSRPRGISTTQRAVADDRFKSAMLGVAASLAITFLSIAVAVYLRRRYSAGLFLGVPFTIGYISSYIYNYRADRAPGQSITLALASVTIAAGAMVVFALEGLICIGMALPLAWIVAWPGAVLGRIMARRATLGSTGVGMALLTPLLLGVEPRLAPSSHEVVTVVEIAAPPEVVWRHVVTFPELPPPTEGLFRAGVAAPLRARIEGSGVSAVRYCDFTTGSFVEPITAWDQNRLLAFDITAQAPPMTEWSPYRDVNPPHLDGYFRATHGEFRLTPLPGGRTRLEGRTTYVVDMFPQRYWTLPAGRIVAAIHERVLRHIAALAEEEEP
ncbi:MAG TPA: SRPBCC family protein [Gemmatimonadales bacterium]|nr:SRPBCC family protein [Gemmatimonadales bacterium]